MKMKKFALRGLGILAIVVALCIFFSGTVRTMTTPKVRFAQAKMGKMEQETELTGKVVFPEEEELSISIPEGITLTVTRVNVAPGDKVKAGGTLLSMKVTDGEKTLDSLRKESATAQQELRSLKRKNGEIRLTKGEMSWQAAWEKEEEARDQEREARIDLQAALRQAGLEMAGDELPEGAGDALTGLYETWKQNAEALQKASGELEALSRYEIPEDTWKSLQQRKEYEQTIADAEAKMTTLQVLSKMAEKFSSPRAAYITEVNVEKGSVVDADTVVLKMTSEGSKPVIRVDLSDVRQEVNAGTTL